MRSLKAGEIREQIVPLEPPKEEAAPVDKPKESKVAALDQPTEKTSTAPPAKREAIRITPKSPIPAPQTQEAVTPPKKQEPIVIKPRAAKENVTVPVGTEDNRFLKRESDAIVIRPPASGQAAAETVVIRPRTPAKENPTPQLLHEDRPNIPIKIGKEVPADSRRRVEQTPAEVARPTMKKETNTIPPSPSEK